MPTILLALVLPALADDALSTVPELVGTHLRVELPVELQPGTTCETVPAVRATMYRGDVTVLIAATGTDARWSIDSGQNQSAPGGTATLRWDVTVGTRSVCVEREGAAARIALEVTSRPYTQVALADVNPDGTARTRSITSKTVEGAPIVSTSWMNSDFVHLDRFLDGDGRELQVSVTHDERRRVYVYDATLAEPVPVGGSLVLDTWGLTQAKGFKVAAPDTVTYTFTHSPNVGIPTRRVEVYRLPANAVVTDAMDFTARERDGRVELVRTVVVPPNGSVTTRFTYTLAGASGLLVTAPSVVTSVPAAGASNIDPSMREIRVTFDRDMADRSWSWVQVADGTYPQTTGDPSYADPRTCVLPVKLKPVTDYVVWINRGQYDNFRDASGTPSEPYELRFRTAGR